MSLDWILHQEKDWLVVNKPAGLSVHNEPGKDLISIFSALLKRPVSPVFRLDQETSGLIILSLTSAVTALWHKSLENSSTEKNYLCVVRGVFESQKKVGVWNAPLSDKSEGRKNPQGVTSDRKSCETEYQVLASNQYFSLLSCRLKTGRQHQIRKHAVLSRHAVLGDTRYGDVKFNNMVVSQYGVSRMALHAHQLKCIFNQQSYVWVAPAPLDFSILLP